MTSHTTTFFVFCDHTHTVTPPTHTPTQTEKRNRGGVRVALKTVALLNPLTDDQINRIAEAVQVVNYKKGDIIIRWGEVVIVVCWCYYYCYW